MSKISEKPQELTDADSSDREWSARLLREAQHNVWFALWQILKGSFVFSVIIVLDQPFVLGYLERLAQQGLTNPNLNWLWVVKWIFALGTGLYVFSALVLFCISVRHMREARSLEIGDGYSHG